ncbi:MAG: L,D-transpeptidase [Clostridia bacterium]|nr:L,D-transpeptidase [Clostridia bacterium]MBP6950381.1 L,D-transpeptidase [Clostridia bacterium]
MRRLGHYIPVILGIVMVLGALFLTGGFFAAPLAEFEETTFQPPLEVTSSMAPTGLSYKKVPIVTVMRSTTESSTSSATATTTTTKKTTTTRQTTTVQPPSNYTGGRFSKLIVFLDIQRVVFYKTDSVTGADVPAYAVRCSTGMNPWPTPTTPPDKPIIISGHRRTLVPFASSKSEGLCWVRYATHIRSSIWFHSIPLDYENGQPIDYSKAYMKYGYVSLYHQRKSSHGCIRLAVRDAKFLHDNARRGLPVYILSSSKGYQLAPAQPLPVPQNPELRRGWDPTDWNAPNYKPMTTTTTTTTTVTEPTTILSSTSPETTTTAPTTTAPTTTTPTTTTTTTPTTTTQTTPTTTATESSETSTSTSTSTEASSESPTSTGKEACTP